MRHKTNSPLLSIRRLSRSNIQDKHKGWSIVLHENPSTLSFLEIQSYGSDPFLLTLADFALTVEIPYRPGERFEQFCVRELQSIVNMVRG